jgi:hypothetical protein
MVLARVSALALVVSLCSPHSHCTSSYVHYTHRTSSLCLPARLTGAVNTRGECLLPWPDALWRLRHARGQRWRPDRPVWIGRRCAGQLAARCQNAARVVLAVRRTRASVGRATRIPAPSVAGRSPDKDHSVVAGCVRVGNSKLLLVALSRVLLTIG